MNKKIEEIIINFLNNSANNDELNLLSKWIKVPENLEIFKEYIEINYASNYNFSVDNNEKIIKNILSTIRKEKPVVRKLKIKSVYKYAVAAILVIGLVSVFFYQSNIANKLDQDYTKTIIKDIKPGIDKATLILEDGSKINLEENITYKNQNASNNGQEIVYKQKRETKISYNYLTVPIGGKYAIQLSDGTKVWLNSMSKLKYPTQFIDGKPRQVELIYGEAFFDVTKSNDQFIVKNNKADITVLGTKFNISSYNEDNYFSSTLVEGSVKIDTNGKSVLLRPNERAKISNSKVEINTVDTYIYTAWVDGKFYFEKQTLKDILTRLSRWYSLNVSFESEDLMYKTFTGVASKNAPIEDLLELINKSTNIDYKILKKKEENLFELVVVNKQ